MSEARADACSSTPIKPRRHWFWRLLIVFLLLTVAAELYARFQLGLGNPPLLMRDPDIEYLYQPSKTYNRFGNIVSFNQWSMRSGDFPATKSDPRELRILLLGDSVINGGTQTTQADLASEIIHRELPSRINDRPVVVGNVSAGSWGPQNLLAYMRKHGTFDADIIIIVLSSHDWADIATFEPLGIDMPTRRPIIALEEVFTRYLPRYLPKRTPLKQDVFQEQSHDESAVRASLDALADLMELASRNGAKLAIAQHLERNETLDASKPGHRAIRETALQAGVDIIQLGPSFEQARRAGEQPYRDHIHPNELGQRVIARTLMDWIVAHVRERDAATQQMP